MNLCHIPNTPNTEPAEFVTRESPSIPVFACEEFVGVVKLSTFSSSK